MVNDPKIPVEDRRDAARNIERLLALAKTIGQLQGGEDLESGAVLSREVSRYLSL
jgi:hypothetical protein